MPSPQVRLNPQQAEDFTLLCGLGSKKLDAVLAALEKADRPLLSAAELRQLVTETLGEDGAGALLRQLVSFGVGVRRKILEADVVDAISEALKSRSLDSTALQQWEDIKEPFWRFLDQKQIRHAVKAFDLSFDYTNLFDDARIITDMRPVFDDEHTSVIANVVRHIMRLSYMSGDGRARSLSIAIDRKDVEELRACCDEALKKEAILTRYLAEPQPVPKLTPGDERDELR